MAFLRGWEKVLAALGAVILLGLAWLYGYRLGYLSVVNPPTEVILEGPREESAGSEAILVHVAGAVRRPGVYELPPGARVLDAIRKAGGTTKEASLESINLAAFLEDGEKVEVPRKARLAREGEPSTEVARVSKVTKVNVNTASAQELEVLPEIGPSLAQRIIEHRKEHGPFRRPEDLLAVKGIGPKKLEQIRPFIEF